MALHLDVWNFISENENLLDCQIVSLEGQVISTNRCFLPQDGVLNFKLVDSENCYDEHLMILMPDYTISDISKLLHGFCLGQQNSSENLDSHYLEEPCLSIREIVKKSSSQTKSIKGEKTFQCSSCGIIFKNYKIYDK